MRRNCPEHPGQPANTCTTCARATTTRPDDFTARYHQAMQEARAEHERLHQEAMNHD